MKDGRGKFLFVHFKKAEDIHVPVSCRTGNNEGNQKENNVVCVREIVNHNLNVIKMKRTQNIDRKKHKQSLERSEEGSTRKGIRGMNLKKERKRKKIKGIHLQMRKI